MPLHMTVNGSIYDIYGSINDYLWQLIRLYVAAFMTIKGRYLGRLKHGSIHRPIYRLYMANI